GSPRAPVCRRETGQPGLSPGPDQRAAGPGGRDSGPSPGVPGGGRLRGEQLSGQAPPQEDEPGAAVGRPVRGPLHRRAATGHRSAPPLDAQGAPGRHDLAMDMDPYLFDGRVAGCLARLSSSALLNVTAGAGSIVPTYIVEGAA